jgi:hypothetical protein
VSGYDNVPRCNPALWGSDFMAEREGFYAALISKAEVLAKLILPVLLVKNIVKKVPAAVPGLAPIQASPPEHIAIISRAGKRCHSVRA